jgi:outer membrane autotransporter protein
LLAWIAALLATFATVAPASAQQPVMTITGATPSTFSGPGETITFHVSLGGSNAVTNSVELTRIAYGTVGPISCVGLPLEPLESTTCSFTYTTQPGNVFNLNQSGTFRVTTLGAPRTRDIANTFTVPYVPVPPTASISAVTSTVTEDGAQSLSYTVTLSTPAAAPISVNFSLGGSADGADYTASGNPLVIATGNTTGTITLDPTTDTDIEADETVTVDLVAGSGYTLGAPTSATGTIVNDDVPSLTIGNITVGEGNAGTADAVFTVTLSAVSTQTVTVNYATADATATAGSDYTAQSGTLTFAPGQTTQTVTVPVIGETLPETNETFIVGLSAAANATIATVTGTGTITNDDVPVTLSPSLPPPTVGVAYNQAVSASGGNGSYTFALISGALPTGLTLSADGTISGTPTAGGSFLFRIAATDTSAAPGPYSGSLSYAVTVAAPTLVVTPAAGTLTLAYGAPYSQDFATSGGTGPYTYSLTAGALPVGVSFSSTGRLSGTPTVPGSYPLTIRATDSSTGSGAPYSVDNNYVLQVGAPVITIGPATLPDGAVGATYSAALSASGGVAPYSYSLLSGALPVGMTFSSAGQFAGIPRTAGNFSLTVRATDGNGQTGTQVVDFSIAAPTLTIMPATLPDGTRNVAYSQSLSTSGGIAPYTYSIVSGNLPIGVSFSSAGVFSGTPTTAGSYTMSIRSTDDAGYNTTVSYTINVASPSIVITPATLPNGAVGTTYSAVLSASGGVGPYSYSLLSGALPIGVSFSSAGQFAGTPRSDGDFSLNVRATDSNGNTGTQVVDFSIAAPTLTVTPATLPDGTTNVAYSQSLTTSGGIAPYTYSIVSGNLPIGVSFSSAGVFSGTPTTAGSYTTSIRSTDDAGYNTTVSYTINVASPSIVIDPPTLDAAVVGDPYTVTLTASGGVAPYGFSLQSGALPPGVSFNSAGAFTGTPSTSGSYTLGVRATDSNGNSGTRAYTLVVDPRTLVLTPASLSAATAGTAYSVTFSASGGIGAYQYAVTAGALPAGLSLDGSSGVLSGTPTAGGAFTFDITANDSGGGTPGTVTAAYNLAVASPTLTLTPAALPAGTGGVAYSQALTASGGIAPYSYVVSAGSLPAGLSLTAAGLLSGTPTVAGSFAFSVTATDSTTGVAGTAVHNYTLVLAAPAIAISPATVPNGVRGVAYSQTLSASGGTAGYTFAVTAGALPTGLTLSAAGVLSGTPTVAASNTFTVTATDALGFSASQAYTQAIAETAPVAHADAATTLGAAAVTVAVTANDTGLIDSIAITTAPVNGTVVVTGLTAVYTANANYSGTDTFAYTATGPGGTSAPALVTITVNPLAVAVSRTVAAVAGMPVTVDLTQGASGGPFTAATLVSLNPAASGTATIAQIGTGASAIYRLTYTPVSTYSGAATVSFTLSNAFSTSAQAVITFNVAPRPDPTQDAEVRGLLNAQVASTRRFATSQMNNFQQRLERLHGAGERKGFDNGLSVAADQRCEQRVGAIPGRTCDRNSPGNEFDGGNGPAGSDLQNHPINAPGNGGAGGPAFGVWAGGMIRSGNQDGRNGSAAVDFETDGVSFGADYRFNDAFVFGAGVGYGRDDSDIGEHGSRSEGDAFTLAAYASYSPGERFFLDGLVGYQQLNYDLRRYVTVNANTVAGSRDGDQWFASVSAGADIQNGDWQVTPYARMDVAQATLEGYTETGDPLYALAYGDMDVDTTTGNLGVRVDYRVRTGWGLFSPQLRLEYQHDFQGNGAAAMQYADFLTGPVYRAELDDFDRNRVNVGLGGLFGFDTWSLRLEYRGLIGSGGDSDHGVLLNIEKRL